MRFIELMTNSLASAVSPKQAEYTMEQYLGQLREMCGVGPAQMLLSDIADYCAIVHGYSMQQDAPNAGMRYFLAGRNLLCEILDGLEQDIENNDIFVGTMLRDLDEIEEADDNGAGNGCEIEELGDDWERQYPPLFAD